MMRVFGLSFIYIAIAVIAKKSEVYSDIKSRTFGGNELSNIKKAPHQVSIQYCGKHECGGSIIAKDWIITSARCVRKRKCCYSIRVGSLHHNEGGTIYKVAKIIIHEYFNIDTNGFAVNDIALVYLNASLIFNSVCNSIALANINGVISSGGHINIYSWNNSISSEHSILKIYKTKTIGKDTCNTIYENYGGIYDNQGCVNDHHNRVSLCPSDVGGPIVYKSLLFGILSRIEDYGQRKYPYIFTEITAYRIWIRRHSGI